jgi:hypothetical protein
MTDRTAETSPTQSSAKLAERAFVALMLAKLKAGEDLRRAKVDRLKDAILADDYENSLKLDIAADRIVDAMEPLSMSYPQGEA